MQLVKKNIFKIWSSIAVMMIAFSLIVTAGGASERFDQDLQSTFDANEILLNEMTHEMIELLVQIEAIHRQGELPTIELPLGINVESFDLLMGFMNGINIPLLVNIGGIGQLNEALFNNFTYSTILSGNLEFSDGILNGSATVDNSRLPQQTLEARVAAQEYLLYVTDAIRGALRLILLLDMDENSVDTDMLAGARSFLAFNMGDLNQKRDEMYSHFGQETVTMRNIRSVTRSVSDIVRDVDGEGYDLLIELRNYLLGGGQNVNILIDILAYAERAMSGELIEKYHYIDFADTDVAVDQLFGYLLADTRDLREVLVQLVSLTEPFATLLNEAESEIMELAFSQFPDFLEFSMPILFGDVDSVDDVVEYLDTVIVVLEEMQSEMQGINLGEGRRLVTEVLSGEILDRYSDLQDARPKQVGTLFRYIRDDIDSVIAILEVADLIDQEFAPFIEDRYISDLLKEYIIITAPSVIDNGLASLLAEFGEWDVLNWGVGSMVIEILEPEILNFNILETIDDLQSTSDFLSSLIPAGERIEQTKLRLAQTIQGIE